MIQLLAQSWTEPNTIIGVLATLLLGLFCAVGLRIWSRVEAFPKEIGKLYGHVDKKHAEQESKIGHVRVEVAELRKDVQHIDRRVNRIENAQEG